MKTIEANLTRRSIRKFTTESVPEDLVRNLIKAAMYAPTAYNQQPWCFVVVRDRQTLDRLPEVHPDSSMVRTAPLAKLVCGDKNRIKSTEFWAPDCAAATQNILLAAMEQGLGTVWTGVYPKKELVDGIRYLLEIPDHIIPFSLIVVGYPAEKNRSQIVLMNNGFTLTGGDKRPACFALQWFEKKERRMN